MTPSEPAWTKSSRCGSSACVEAAPTDGGVLMRDSKNPAREPLAFTLEEWREFVRAIRAGEFR